jgi:hypothetical protein
LNRLLHLVASGFVPMFTSMAVDYTSLKWAAPLDSVIVSATVAGMTCRSQLYAVDEVEMVASPHENLVTQAVRSPRSA